MIRRFETRDEEILTILAEECAELIQEIMKMKRKDHYRSETFESEVGDVLCLINLLYKEGMVDASRMVPLMDSKKEKLKKWSNVYG